MMRAQHEIEDQRNEAAAIAAEEGTRVPALSYEEGVADALAWAMGESDELPIEPV